LDIWERRKHTGGLKRPSKVGLEQWLKEDDIKEVDYTDIYGLENGVGYGSDPKILEERSGGWYLKTNTLAVGSGYGAGRCKLSSIPFQEIKKRITLEFNCLQLVHSSRIIIQAFDQAGSTFNCGWGWWNSAYHGMITTNYALGIYSKTFKAIRGVCGIGFLVGNYNSTLATTGELENIKILAKPQYWFNDGSIWDRSNTDIWKTGARDSITYDSDEPCVWEAEDLLQINNWIQPEYENMLFVKSKNGVITDILTYSEALTGFALQKTINYCK